MRTYNTLSATFIVLKSPNHLETDNIAYVLKHFSVSVSL